MGALGPGRIPSPGALDFFNRNELPISPASTAGTRDGGTDVVAREIGRDVYPAVCVSLSGIGPFSGSKVDQSG